MPRWASRITLEIVGVRLELLQDISAEDVASEGVHTLAEAMWGRRWWVDAPLRAVNYARIQYGAFWDTLATPGNRWEDNPYVWVIETRRVEPR